MKRRLILLMLTLCLLLSGVPAAFATETTEATEAATEETRPADSCGDSLTWSFYEGTLTVTGTGAMDDMSGGAPWGDYKDDITTLVLSGGVTTVGAEAFADCDNLVTINFGASLREIDTGAFRNCDGLTSIRLPASFRRFGKECFQNTSKLTEVHCEGGMPSFNGNCLWNGNYVTVYCPTNNIWPETYVQELETNFGGRLEILAADGSDPFHFEEETEEETTEATTEPTTEPTTEATEPETEPTTEATTEPVTEAATAPTSEATEAPTEEETEGIPQFTEPEKERTGGAAGIAIGVMVVSGLGIGIILYALKSGKKTKGGKYQA